MSKPKVSVKVYFTGGDRLGWFFDDELAMTKKLLDFVQPANLLTCQIIQTVNWQALLHLPKQLLVGKYVIAHMNHDPRAAIQDPNFNLACKFVSLWVARSSRSAAYLASLNLNVVTVPYLLDGSVFFPMSKTDPALLQLREKYRIPGNTYLIGSFQRDTEGKDLKSPKLVKGPDLFLDIVTQVFKQRARIHVVLAGPRRFWLRDKLSEAGIPFTFVGVPVSGDDVHINTLPKSLVNQLYNLMDLYLVSSRLEGGPQAVIECGATKCKILSSDVGHAPDVLSPACIYDSIDQAASTILEDIHQNSLAQTVDDNYEAIRRNLPSAVYPQWIAAYEKLVMSEPITWSQLERLPGLLEIGQRLVRRVLHV